MSKSETLPASLPASNPEDVPKLKSEEAKLLAKCLSSQAWRLQNLYYIIDVHGKKIKFSPNWAQARLYNSLHSFNVILKARQLGMSTFLLILALDEALFNDNFASGVIAHTREDSENLFKNKARFAYDNLPEWLKRLRSATSDSARRLEFSNGSSIVVGTSLRGGTFQFLHVSEFGKIAARYPEKAREIKTGALNTIHGDQKIFIESTAEGNSGDFYDLCQRAMRLNQEGVPLTDIDPKLHFYPWHKNPGYRLDEKIAEHVSITRDMEAYFNNEAYFPDGLDAGQRAWYVKKSEQQGEDMKREFPSTADEAFEQSTEGAIYAKEMRLIRERGQIGDYLHEPGKRVLTFWDLGKGSDYTSIWFMQHIGNEYRFIDYHESHNEGWDFYARLLQMKPYVYGEHVLPWDGDMKVAGKQMTTVRQMLWELGVQPVRCVEKTKNVWVDIKTTCRPALTRCNFDRRNCELGIKALDNYRREWDDRMGQWKDKPRHDEHSHGADAFRTFALGFQERYDELMGVEHASVYAETADDLFAY